MNTSVRINVRATFGDTIKQFQNLRTVLASFDKQVQAVDKSLITLGDMFQRNAAEAEAWAAKIKDAAGAAGVAGAAMAGAGKGGAKGGGAALPPSGLIAGAASSVGKLGDAWIAAGKKAQWTGSMMTYTLTVPLAAALYLGMKANSAFQDSLTQLQQAYRYTTTAATDLVNRQKEWNADSPALTKIILAMSDAYGISASQIGATAAELARMGDSSVTLATDLDTVTRLQRTYNLTASAATQIVSQSRAAWGANAAQTRDNTNALAVFQEMSRGSFDQLAAGVNKLSQPARMVGLTYKQTAAMVALLLQQVNSTQGSTLGNSLTTVFARIFTLVPKAKALLEQYGVAVNNTNWANDTAAQRLQLIADKYVNLSRNQQAVLTNELAGNRQARALGAILNDLGSKQGLYNEMLNATSDTTKNAAFAQHQLQLALLQPKANFDQLKVSMQNSFMTIAADLTPAILYLGHVLTGAANWFANLPAGTQHWIELGLAIMMVMGPILKIGGALVTLGGVALKASAFVLTALPEMLMGPLGVIVLGLGVVLLAVTAFGGNIQTVFNGLITMAGFVAAAIYNIFSFIAGLFGQSAGGMDKLAGSMNNLSSKAKAAAPSAGGAGAGNTLDALGDAGAAAAPTLNQAADNAQTLADNAATAAASVADLTKQTRAAQLAVDAQAASVLRLKVQTDHAAQALTAANLQLRLLNQEKAKITAARNLLGDPNALMSQVNSLRDMGRAIAAGGNSALARRYSEQADLLQKQAEKATGLDSSLSSVNAQIDSQQALVDQLTKAHDTLAATYQNEANKLADLRQQYSALSQQLAQAKKDSAAASKAAGAGAPGTTPGAGNASLSSQTGNLTSWLKNFQGGIKMPKIPNMSGFFADMQKSWSKGWDAFGKQSGAAKAFESPAILGLAIAAPMILGKIAELLFSPMKKLFVWGVGEALTAGSGAMKGAASLGGKMFSMAFSGMSKLITTVLPAIAEAAMTAVEAFGTAIGVSGVLLPLAIIAAILLVAVLLVKYHKQIFAFGEKVVKAIWEGIQATWAALCNLADYIVKWLASTWKTASKAVSNFAKSFVSGLWDFFKQNWLLFVDFPLWIALWLIKSNNGIAKSIRDFASKMVGGMWNGIVAAWNALVRFNDFLSKWLAGAVTGGAKAIASFGTNLVSGIWNAIRGAWHLISNGLTNLLNSTGSSMGAIMKAPINAVIAGLNAALDFIGSINFKVPDWIPKIGGNSFGFPTWHVNYLANGGLATKATPAIIGEAGPEAVIPLSANNPFVQIFAATVASRMVSAMSRVQHSMGPASVSHVNSHNVTNNIKVDINHSAQKTPAADAKQIARELGAALNSRGIRTS